LLLGGHMGQYPLALDLTLDVAVQCSHASIAARRDLPAARPGETHEHLGGLVGAVPPIETSLRARNRPPMSYSGNLEVPPPVNRRSILGAPAAKSYALKFTSPMEK
jgi:hypothetical protein